MQRNVGVGPGEESGLPVSIEMVLDQQNVRTPIDAEHQTVMVDGVAIRADGLQNEEGPSPISQRLVGHGEGEFVRCDGTPRVLSVGDGVVVKAECHDEAIVVYVVLAGERMSKGLALAHFDRCGQGEREAMYWWSITMCT